MDGSGKPSGPPGVVDWAIVVFFSVLTAGVLPAVFYSMARAERQRLRRFFLEGVYGTAEIRKIELESTAFGEKLARVAYEFVADGVVHRDSDRVRPVIAGKWMPGDTIEILYLPNDEYDSAIISTT